MKLKRFVSIIICMCLMLGIFSVCAFAETKGIFRYNVSKGKAIIYGINKRVSGDIVIPSKIGGYPVEGIGERAFYENSKITSVKISEGIEYIGTEAFTECSNIEKVTFPSTLKVIYDTAFWGCKIKK